MAKAPTPTAADVGKAAPANEPRGKAGPTLTPAEIDKIKRALPAEKATAVVKALRDAGMIGGHAKTADYVSKLGGQAV